MQTEIERKFLVKSDAFKKESDSSYEIRQGFLSRDPERTVRIRIKGSKGFITVKGLTYKDGLSRLEWEKEIDLQDAQDLLQLCEAPIIYKTRYEVHVEQHIFEIDEFHGKHQGLTIAEVELQYQEESFVKPKWLGKEVTGDKAYYNSQL
ncbi:CYTH domain-containing protein [Flavobacteriaceae bacterium 14752]|uniref:CYTH domain-containing protein n=1 Tax=Mesohalobacter salilacus TaxID=2491711 RepID=UPI000F641868|nr:CYTH domain-containing protein [Flavobacteriaceae bacterium 14752]